MLFYIMMREEKIIPINCDYPLNEEVACLPLIKRIENKKIRRAILLASGFSGVNGALIIERGL